MGMIVEFPADAATRRLVSNARALRREAASRRDLGRDDFGREEMGVVVILPVVRIERHHEGFNGDKGPDAGATSKRPRKRRARS
jgi:hypothetical protein